jgi:lipopolysaccharide/colanic/teichoic acid biosynthesis glycosyltransferase
VIKRAFDIISSGLVLLVFSPVFLFVAISIVIDSKGGVFYMQERIGKNGVPFKLFKFRTMRPNQDGMKITIGHRDPRVTNVGYYLRKFKVDEFPQLINILKGEMSVVGPRPEVERYVAKYNDEQRRVLSVKPGLTDYASLEYVHESELLAQSSDPEHTYIHEIMPDKLRLNLRYINDQSLTTDVKIILRTIAKILR